MADDEVEGAYALDGEYRTSAAPPPKIPTPDDLDLVVLETTHDPMRAESLRALLESEGIVVATPGLEHRVMLGAIGRHVEITVRVPRKRLRKAKRILEAFGADRPIYSDLRRWRVAGFAACVVPFGGGHLYAGAYASAAVLAGSQLLALWGVLGARVILAPIVALAVVLCDVWGSREACARANRKLAVESGWLSRGALLGFAIVPVGLGALHLVGPTIFAGPEGRALCALNARCAEEDERGCLDAVARDRLDGVPLFDSRECVACYSTGDDCDAIFERCAAVCHW